MEADRHRGHGGDGGGGTTGARPKENAVADGELSEDEKMEKFYELIRKHKEIQDLQRIERERTSTAVECKDSGGDDNHDIEREMRRKRMKLGDREQSSWIPAFKWEDFTENAKVEFQRSPATLPASNFSDDGKTSSMHVHVKDSPPSVQAEASGGGLDLKLGL